VDIQGQAEQDESPLESTDHYYGAEMKGGFEFMTGHSFGFYLAYSYSLQFTGSALYVDEQMKSSRLEAGIIILMFKEKHYFY
jgi:hypothetical protein